MGKSGEGTKEDVADGALGDCGRWQAGIVALMAGTKLPVIWALLGIVFLASPQIPASKPTIATEWELVGARKQLVNLSQLVFITGVLIGNGAFSALADRVGRKKPIIATGVIMGVAGSLAALSHSLWLFTLLRFVQALAVGGSIATTHVMCLEVLGAKSRATVGAVAHLAVYAGTGLSALIAYLTPDWRSYQLSISLPALLSVSFYWLLPESPRWLMAVGRNDEALEILRDAARVNKNPVPSSLPSSSRNGQERSKARTLDLVRTPNLRFKSLDMWFSYWVVGVCFYGTEQYLTEISGTDLYLNVATSGAVMVPGVLVAMLTMQKLGRRSTQFTSQLVSAVCFFVITVYDGSPVLNTVLGICGVTGAAVTFTTVYLYGAELFPTVLRNTGVGVGSMASRVGAMIAPFVVSLNGVSRRLPPAIFAVGCFSAAALTLFLPETLNCQLPETVEDAENFSRNYKRVDFTEPQLEGKEMETLGDP